MQGEALDSRERRSAVEQVADDGEAEGGEVGADLVGTTGARRSLDQSVELEAFQDEQLCYSGFAPAVVDHGAVAAVSVRAERLANRLFSPFGDSTNQGVVNLFDRAVLELGIQVAVGFGAAGKDDHPARSAIQAMDDPQLAVKLLQLTKQVRRIRMVAIHQGGKPRRLICDKKMVIDIEQEVFGLEGSQLKPVLISYRTQCT